MIDVYTDFTTLYVMVDDFCQSWHIHKKHSPGPTVSLQCSEVITLAVFGQIKDKIAGTWKQYLTKAD
jgi:hypothetical protein